MTGGTTIATNGTAEPPSPDSEEPEVVCISKPSRTPRKTGCGVEEITRLTGDLAKQLVVLSNYKSEPSDLTAAAAESALKTARLDDLSDALLSLEDSPASHDIIGKAVRAVERLRRTCTSILSAKGVPSSLLLAVQQWLIGGVDLAEDILKAPIVSRSLCSYEISWLIPERARGDQGSSHRCRRLDNHSV